MTADASSDKATALYKNKLYFSPHLKEFFGIPPSAEFFLEKHLFLIQSHLKKQREKEEGREAEKANQMTLIIRTLKCKIVIDTIRSQSQYSSAYEYQGTNNKYLAGETNDTMLSFVSKSAINALTIGSYNGFYETIATLVIGYYCPQVGELIDVINLVDNMVTGKIDAISFGAFIAEYCLDMKDIAMALNFFSSASDVIDCDVVVGDPVIRISFSAYAYAEYVFDADHNIKKVRINYTV